MKWLLAPVLLLGAMLPARADTYLVLPFFNLTNSQNLDWIGESISETIRESMAVEGLVVLEREDRQEAYRRLSVRPNALLTRATVVKIGTALDAGTVIYGEYSLTPTPDAKPPSRGSLKITAHILDLRHMREGPEFPEIGALEDLAFLETHLAWQSLQFVIPKTAPSEEDFRKARPPVRVDAIENYTRGLLAAFPEQQQVFFLQAARLDARFSQPDYQLGRLFYTRKDYQSAAQWLEKVSNGDTHYHEANFLLGLSRYHLGDYAGAVASFQVVAHAVPLNEVYNDLGAAQLRSGLPGALDSFKKAVDGDPADPVYQFNAGYALWQRGDFPAAAGRFRAALERDPNDAQAAKLAELCGKKIGPGSRDPGTAGLERLKTEYEESAYWQLKAVLQSGK
ncbi:MAG: tetratricopeptide repeat protein [Bryobacteraceae bacterium]